MSQLLFRYNSQDIIYNCQQGEQLPTILQSFSNQIRVKRNNLAFLCNGSVLNDQSTIENLTPNSNNQIIILVTDLASTIPLGPVMKKSHFIICPQCKESTIISINDYKISLSQCKNGHKIDNILLSQFNDTQIEDISKICCGSCNVSRAVITGYLMYICTDCKMNLCPLCKSKHDQNHNFIDYENKNYICEKDGEYFNMYCYSCKKNICSSCEIEHNNHEKITFGNLIGNKKDLQKKNEILKNDINGLKNLINEISNKLRKVSENLDIYYDINKTVVDTTRRVSRNSEELISLNEINNNTIHKDIINIIKQNNINNQIKDILEMYKKMENVENINIQNQIEYKYKNEKEIYESDKKDDNVNQIKEQIPIHNEKISEDNNIIQSNNNIINNNNSININNNSSELNQNVININEKNENKINNNVIINNNDKINTDNKNNNQININSIETNNIINTNENNIKQSNNNEASNKINNNIINTNQNNNNNQNTNQTTPGNNNNISLDLKPNSNSELEMIDNLLNIEMENEIREDIDSKTPLISDVLDTKSLLTEYQNNELYLNSVQIIANKYKLMRKIRRDGNCFYRGFIFRIFEYISKNKNSDLYEKMIKKIDEARDLAKKNYLVSNLIDDFYNVFIGEFCSCYNALTNSGISCIDYLEKLFDNNNKEKCNYLILFVRYCISQYLRENKLLYEAYVDRDFDNWLITEVEPIDKEADQIQIMACVNFFDLGVKIEYLNKDKNELMKFPEDKDEKDIFINFLFTPGHYDLLYVQ